MSFVQRELDRIANAILERQEPDPTRDRLIAAQQALSWALEPIGCLSPYDYIVHGGPRVQAELK